MPWVFDPHTGGVKIPEATRRQTIVRIERYAAEHYAGKYTRLDIRFRGTLCYIDAFTEPDVPTAEFFQAIKETREQYLERLRATPTHLCRLRHFTQDRWSLAFYSYGGERYEPAMFPNGTFFGTPEEGFEVGAMYLQ